MDLSHRYATRVTLALALALLFATAVIFVTLHAVPQEVSATQLLHEAARAGRTP